MSRHNGHGRRWARELLSANRLRTRKGPNARHRVVLFDHSGDEPARVGSGPDLVAAIEDALADDDLAERCGRALHLAAALAEDAGWTVMAMERLVTDNGGPPPDPDDPERAPVATDLVDLAKYRVQRAGGAG